VLEVCLRGLPVPERGGTDEGDPVRRGPEDRQAWPQRHARPIKSFGEVEYRVIVPGFAIGWNCLG